MKLDPVKVEWIVREKGKGELAAGEIAARMGVSRSGSRSRGIDTGNVAKSPR